MTSPDKLYALQLSLKECGVMLTAEQVRRVLDHAWDVAAVAATPVVESSGALVLTAEEFDRVVRTCLNPPPPSEKLIELVREGRRILERKGRWPAYGPGPGGQTDREGR